MAEAIAGFWEPGPASDALRRILEKLLRVTARFAQPEPTEAEERVSRAVYVMY